MPASYTFGITGGATGSIIVNSVSLSHTSSKQELQGPTGNIAAVGYNKFKTEVSISGVGDAGSLAVGGALGTMPGNSSGTYPIDSISTSRSIDGFAEFEITATKN
jgi:hypothetical protein